MSTASVHSRPNLWMVFIILNAYTEYLTVIIFYNEIIKKKLTNICKKYI